MCMKKFNNKKGFYIYGRNAVLDTLASDPEKVVEVFHIQEKGKSYAGLEPIIDLAKFLKIRTTAIDTKKAESFVREGKTQGVIAYYTGFSYTHYKDFEEKYADNAQSCVVVLDGVEDVQNFGAIIRTAAAVGVDAILISDFHQAPVTGGTFKASAGTINKVDIIQFAGMGQVIESLKKADYWLYGIDMDDTAEYPSGNIWQQKFDGRTAIILGGEGGGISEKAKAKCDFIAPIPMEGEVESLNVSVAAAVALYEWKRQQQV